MFYSLHEFMLRAENITYLFLAIYLIGVVVFWQYLTQKDKDEE